MLNQAPLFPVSLGSSLPPPLRPMASPLESALQRWVMPDSLLETFRRAQRSGRGAEFAKDLLGQLEIRFTVTPRDRARIPSSGAAIVAANHPYGIVEGLILTVLLDAIRPDYKLLANVLLSSVDAMAEHTILVNPFGTPEAKIQNRAPLRGCIRWLCGGGLLAMFPSGEVAHLKWTEHAVIEPDWNTTPARLALRAAVPVIPVFIEGTNSLPFHLAGTLHPGLRTIGLLREFLKMRGKNVRVRIGSAISPDVLTQYRTAACATEYLRSRTLFLANRPWREGRDSRANSPSNAATAVPAIVQARSFSDEIAGLGPRAELARTQEFSVYVAAATQIPHLLEEIGRAREEAFRRVGEGTGKQVDIDWFDQHYFHLFLWSRLDCRLAGAYRMALTQDVLQHFGVRGLYTHTLFRYRPEFFAHMGPAVELGRSFVCPDYQKSYAPLLLLWKGIARFVQRHPEAPVLFGAASISRDYQAASRGLMACYLSERLISDLASLVKPRRKWREPAAQTDIVKRLAGVAATIEDISLSISDIEEDGKGIPVLIRQYLKAGGKLISFNVDPKFSDAIDALILTDLRGTPLPILERCMGRQEAQAFLEWHASRATPAMVFKTGK